MPEEVADVALLSDAVLALHVEELDPELLAQPHHEDELQQEREEEVGHREAEVGPAGREVVEGRVLADGTHHPDEQPERRGEDDGRADQQERVPRRVAHHVRHRSIGAERGAPISRREVAEPEHVLLGNRLVEVVLVLEVDDRLLRDRRLVPDLSEGVTTRRDQEEDHQRRQYDDRNRDQQPPYDVRAHRAPV